MKLPKELWSLPCLNRASSRSRDEALNDCRHRRSNQTSCWRCDDREPRQFKMVEKEGT